MPADSTMIPRGLLVSHRGERCGVFQFGARLFAALSAAEGIEWHYAECGDIDELLAEEARIRPTLVLLNYHPATLGWATADATARVSAVVFSVFHEAHQAAADALEPAPFAYLLCPDPTLLPRNPIALPVPRFIPAPITPPPPPERFTIGSFGFGTPGKGFDRLCALVNAEFDDARIRINIPFHDLDVMVPRQQLDAIIAACRACITKPGIVLDITHDFLDDAALLAFLAENTINAFTYDDAPNRGISSCTDYALACGRPLAISRSSMFRHLHGVNPSIRVEDRSLRAIAASGIAPLRHHRAAYVPAAAGAAWNRAMLAALSARSLSAGVPDGRGFNKLLDDRSRNAYTAALDDLRRLAPALLERKIARANIQQAFGLDTAERLVASYAEPRILAIGSYEDTTVAVLRAKGFRIEEVDPQVNGLDLDAFMRSPEAVPQSYDMVLCVSVLEHVERDRDFVRAAADLLAPGGVAIFTVDFSNRYPVLGRKPNADQRLYTTGRLRDVLMAALPDCALLDRPSWDDGEDDFDYEDCRYAFASWVFRKLPAAQLRYAIPALISGARGHARSAPEPVPEPEPKVDTAMTAPAAAPIVMAAPAMATPAAPRRVARTVALAVYRRLLRPVARPVLWRLRNFMVGDLHREIATLRETLARSELPGDGKLTRSIEAVLLTLAMDRGKPPPEAPESTDPPKNG